MEIEIERVYETKNGVRVIVSHPYGKDNLGLGARAKNLNPKTGEPRWKSETRQLLEDKYGEVMDDGRASAQLEQDIDDEVVGSKIELKDLPKND